MSPTPRRPSASSPLDESGPGQARRRRGFVLAGLLVAVLLVSGIGMVFWVQNPLADAGAPTGGVAIGGGFELVDGGGRAVTDRDYRGKYLLVYFGYTFCPDVCPTTLSDVAAALDKLGTRAERLQPLFITVDPRRDTPDVIRQYVAAFTPRLVGLTGTADQIKAVTREYRVYYAEHRTGPGPNDYVMDHSSILYLMDPNGRFVSVIRADAGADAIEADLARRLGAG